MADITPKGKEREVKNISGAMIDGTPITYIVVLAAVVTALAFIPFSIVLALGGSFPMSQGIFALIGWLLGPIAGAVASGIGSLIGIFVAPHTSSVWFITLIGAVVTPFAAGCMDNKLENRRFWWMGVAALTTTGLAAYLGRAILINGVSPLWAILASFTNWSSLILFILPTRRLIPKWIRGEKMGLTAVGLALGTWVSFGMAHTIQNAVGYAIFNWPEEVFILLSTVIPFEYLSRAAIGAVIGTGVIAGLRAIGLVKPAQATY